jgi:hypothetical protein
MSAFGGERTCRLAPRISGSDPKLTYGRAMVQVLLTHSGHRVAGIEPAVHSAKVLSSV